MKSVPLRTLLYVEDEADLRELVKDWASSIGVICRFAENGQEALRMVSEEPPSAILSDINMPIMSGMELLSKLRRKGMNAPIVFVTGFDSKENMQDAIRLGAFDFVTKPFDFKALEKIVFRALEVGSRLQQISSSLEGPETSDEIKEEVRRHLHAIELFKAMNPVSSSNR